MISKIFQRMDSDKAQKVIGAVIKVRKVPFENRDTFSPVVRFTTRDGRALSFTDPISRYPAEFEVGERAQVLYNPQNPHKARREEAFRFVPFGEDLRNCRCSLACRRYSDRHRLWIDKLFACYILGSLIPGFILPPYTDVLILLYIHHLKSTHHHS